MSRFPWQRGWKPPALDPRLYSVAARLAVQGEVPYDHPVWKQDAKTGAAHDAEIAQQPDEVPALRQRLGTHRPSDAVVDLAERSAVAGSCPCGVRWTGLSAAHCAACHLTFVSPNGFDEHRVSDRCRSQAELSERGLEPNDKGWWRRPRPEDSIPRRD